VVPIDILKYLITFAVVFCRFHVVVHVKQVMEKCQIKCNMIIILYMHTYSMTMFYWATEYLLPRYC